MRRDRTSTDSSTNTDVNTSGISEVSPINTSINKGRRQMNYEIMNSELSVNRAKLILFCILTVLVVEVIVIIAISFIVIYHAL